MICSNCCEYKLILSIEKYIVTNSPEDYTVLEEIFDYFNISNEEFHCKNCNYTISNGESYIDDNEEDGIIEKLNEYIAEKINKKIVGCESCSEPAQIYNDAIRYFDEEDDNIDAWDTLDNFSIQELIYETFELDSNYDIIKHLHCCCGNGTGIDWSSHIDNGEFDEYTEVYTQENIDRFNEEFYGLKREIDESLNLLANELTIEELTDLKEDYVKNKLYICKNENFQKLENLIKYIHSKKEDYVLAENRTIFRTRAMNNDDDVTEKELWEPPYGISSHGRYNDIGESVLYCANNRDVLKKEVQLGENQEYCFAKFIVNKPLCLFPINNIFKDKFDGLISKEVDNNDVKLKREYIISNIVSAICLNLGYNGITYKSTKDLTSINYALFNIKRGEDLKMISIFKEK